MPHQCTKCGLVYPDAAEELLKGCSCGAKFFYYIRQEKLEEPEVREVITELRKADKVQIHSSNEWKKHGATWLVDNLLL